MKPDDVSQEAWDQAELEVRRWPLNTNCVAEVARAITAAVAAEREACAVVADERAGTIRLGGINAWHGASSIASAIRARSAP